MPQKSIKSFNTANFQEAPTNLKSVFSDRGAHHGMISDRVFSKEKTVNWFIQGDDFIGNKGISTPKNRTKTWCVLSQDTGRDKSVQLAGRHAYLWFPDSGASLASTNGLFSAQADVAMGRRKCLCPLPNTGWVNSWQTDQPWSALVWKKGPAGLIGWKNSHAVTNWLMILFKSGFDYWRRRYGCGEGESLRSEISPAATVNAASVYNQ